MPWLAADCKLQLKWHQSELCFLPSPGLPQLPPCVSGILQGCGMCQFWFCAATEQNPHPSLPELTLTEHTACVFCILAQPKEIIPSSSPPRTCPVTELPGLQAACRLLCHQWPSWPSDHHLFPWETLAQDTGSWSHAALVLQDNWLQPRAKPLQLSLSNLALHCLDWGYPDWDGFNTLEVKCEVSWLQCLARMVL